MKLAIIGRPNAGKSTLLNRLLGEERMITGPEPGLTRDAVAVRLADADGTRIEIVDTAGMRRAGAGRAAAGEAVGRRRDRGAEDGRGGGADRRRHAGLHEQDLQIARLVEREGRALVLALTKWDAVADRDAVRRAIRTGWRPAWRR